MEINKTNKTLATEVLIFKVYLLRLAFCSYNHFQIEFEKTKIIVI